jgi:hypothetical protein
MKQFSNIILFLLFIIFIYPKPSVGENSELKIVQTIINNKIVMWPSWQLWENVKYTKLNENGLPEDLELILEPSTIAFKFDYLGTDNPRFRYQLKGFENKWHSIEYGQMIQYKNIKHGRFTLLIQALQNRKIISEIRFDFFNNLSSFWIYSDFVNLLLILLVVYITIKMK